MTPVNQIMYLTYEVKSCVFVCQLPNSASIDKYKSFIHSVAFSSEKKVLSVSREKYAQLKQVKTVQNTHMHICIQYLCIYSNDTKHYTKIHTIPNP